MLASWSFSVSQLDHGLILLGDIYHQLLVFYSGLQTQNNKLMRIAALLILNNKE